MDFTVFLVRDGFRVDFGDDGEGVKDGESLVFRGAEHLEFVVQQVVPETARLFHPPFCIHRKCVLEVHDLGEGEACDEGHGANHLVVDDIRLYLVGEGAAGALGVLGVPIAHLEGFGGEAVAKDVASADEAVEADETNLAAVGLESFQMLGEDALVADGEEVDVVTLGKLDYLVVGTEFVALFQRPGESWQDNEDFHTEDYLSANGEYNEILFFTRT